MSHTPGTAQLFPRVLLPCFSDSHHLSERSAFTWTIACGWEDLVKMGLRFFSVLLLSSQESGEASYLSSISNQKPKANTKRPQEVPFRQQRPSRQATHMYAIAWPGLGAPHHPAFLWGSGPIALSLHWLLERPRGCTHSLALLSSLRAGSEMPPCAPPLAHSRHGMNQTCFHQPLLEVNAHFCQSR